ncbi:hypothetical protein Tco_0318496 [Tanacetum coccineum]
MLDLEDRRREKKGKNVCKRMERSLLILFEMNGRDEMVKGKCVGLAFEFQSKGGEKSEVRWIDKVVRSRVKMIECVGAYVGNEGNKKYKYKEGDGRRRYTSCFPACVWLFVLTTPIPEDGENATMEQVNSLEAKLMAKDASSKKFLVINIKNYKMTDLKPVLEQYNELLGILRRFTQHKMNMDEAIQDDDVAWWVDLGATVHVCKDRCWFKSYESLNDGSILHMRNKLTALAPSPLCSASDVLGLSQGYRGEAMLIAYYLLNRVPNKMNRITTYELWTKRKSNPNYLRRSKAFRLYVIEPIESFSINSIIESKDAIFDENIFSSVPRPIQRSLINKTKDIGDSMVPEEVTEEVVT